MRKYLKLLALMVVVASTAAGAQTGARVRDAGPGPAGRILRSVLSGPYELRWLSDSARADSGTLADTDTIVADSVHSRSVVLIGGDVVVEGTVEGDVVVVDGDLFLHPGAVISGRAVAIGGGVYNSTLAIVRGGRHAFRDMTYVVTERGDSLLLDYRTLGIIDRRVVWLPGAFGIRIPLYDRANGLSVPFGPTIAWREMSIEVDPLITYRSDLGELDPSIQIRWERTRRLRIELDAGRYSLTNDAWIRGPIINSLTSLILGTDVRNYFRADRGELHVHKMFETATMQLTPWVGVRTERAWSVPPGVGATSGPWSVMGRKDVEEGMWRPNPSIDRGRINSALVGVDWEWEQQRVVMKFGLGVEAAFSAPGDRSFNQGVLDGHVRFPTFGNHSYEAEGHTVLTPGDSAPRQRWAYLGGSGTLPTFDGLLMFGGDHLVYIEQSYHIPVQMFVIKLLGSPRISLRHMMGAAGVGGVPEYHHNVGVRLTLGFARADYYINPENGDSNFSVGAAFGR